MNYPVEGAEKPPTIHERRGIHRILAVPSLKDNNGDDDDRMARCLLKMTFATSTGYIIQQRALNSPHQRKTTGVDQQQLRTDHAPHHCYMPHLITASVDNGRTRIAPDDNGLKAPTKKRTKNEDTATNMTMITTWVEYISPDATRRQPVAQIPVTLLHHQHHHIIIIGLNTSTHHHHHHQQLLPAITTISGHLLGCTAHRRSPPRVYSTS